MSGSLSLSTSTNETLAVRVEGFVQSIGVNTHLGWWNTAWGLGDGQWAGAGPKVLSELSYIGVTNVRDDVPQSYDTTEYASLAEAGIRFDIIQTSNNGQITLGADVADITAFNAGNPGAIVSYEGANEYNNNGYTLNGQNSLNNLGWGIVDDQAIQQAVDANSQLSHLRIVAASTSSASSSPIVGSYVNDSNWHVYAGVGQQLENNIATSAVAAEATAPGAPIIFTEAGVSSSALSSSSWGVAGSDEAQGLIDTNALLDAYKDGVQQTFLYDLMDDNQASDQEDNFGLFNADGTPKAAATDIHDLTTILSDNGSSASTFTTGTLNYTLQDFPSTASSMLLEKSNGAFDIALWNGNASLVNATATASTTVPTTDVMVQLGATYQNVKIFDPVQGATPIETLSNVASVVVPLSADPLIVEVEANASSPTNSSSGSSTTGSSSTPATPQTVVIGSGKDTLALSVDEDAYNGNAQFTISVDGVQVGGVQTTTAVRTAGQTQTFDVFGNWSTGTHTVAVDFLNDSYAGTPQTDRNLYINGAAYDGTAAIGTLTLMSNGTQSMTVGTPIPATITVGSGNDTLALEVSEDAYIGNAQFTVSVDGVQIGGVQTALATHTNSQDQTFDILGNWGTRHSYRRRRFPKRFICWHAAD